MYLESVCHTEYFFFLSESKIKKDIPSKPFRSGDLKPNRQLDLHIMFHVNFYCLMNSKILQGATKKKNMAIEEIAEKRFGAVKRHGF